MLQPVILSGGSGTRLWPLSREHYPKQLLSFAGERSLLQETVLRAGQSGEAVAAPLIVCNEEHRFLVAEQLRELEVTPAGIILEPTGRNTAPALTLAALAVEQQGGDGVMLVMPADHVVRDQAAFAAAAKEAKALAEGGYLVTFGIVPAGPETGYGYIKAGAPIANPGTARGLAAFVEKPDVATAQAYVDAGDYLWNSGMFVMRASAWLQAIDQCRPDIAAACRRAFEGAGEDRDFLRVDKQAFTDCPSDSIDYAVMEKVSAGQGGLRAAVVPMDAGWSDVGAWSAIWEVGVPDGNGNVAKGDVLTHATRNSLLFAESRLVAGVGLEDMVVVETADAVMVAPKSQAQDVKKIVERLKAENRRERLSHRRVHRPWGTYEGIDAGDRFQVKRIVVKPDASLSLQMHHHRAEHWVVVRGTARVTCGEKVFLLSENQSTYIPIGEQHRLENPGTIPLEIIEVQSGSYLGEDDIVRFEDVYGRKESK
ncbi:MAG: mannose-1-phosphate guanylyltransferase/mannose-6-phosphate isomerase [Gammaproteobacteria bacterium]|jgi:mannose-1-phosphate guanylyltransferase/mannose-6-phosphate isomerase